MRSSSVPVGIWQSIPSPVVSRYLARMGWDCVFIDGQHGAISFETAYECIHALRDAGARPYLRVSVGSPSEVQRALDIGAAGVVVPMVNTVREAELLACMAKYPPLGARSLGGDAPVHLGRDYPERANRETQLLVQIEHIDSVEAAREILAVPGVDGCFVGPTDLALSMGLSRKAYEREPAHRRAMARIPAAARATGKLAWCNTYSLGDFRSKLAAGFTGLTLRSEADLLLESGSSLLAQLRKETAPARRRKKS